MIVMNISSEWPEWIKKPAAPFNLEIYRKPGFFPAEIYVHRFRFHPKPLPQKLP